MTDLTLTKTRLFAGVWEGVLTSQAARSAPPSLTVSHQNTAISGVEVAATGADREWIVRIAIPADLIADGVQTFVVTDTDAGETLSSFAILAGDALAEDIRSEMDLLRAELDMLKRAFRRHCVETT